jgi:HEAT repeat protein
MLWYRRGVAWCACVALAAFSLAAQDDVKARVKGVRELGKGGSENIPKLEPFLSDAAVDVRLEAVKAIAGIGTQRSLDPLIKACGDNDPEVQTRAVDGLVNFYVPGYLKTGLTAPLRRAGSSIKGKFTDTNDLVVDPYIQVRPEIIVAIGQVVSGGASRGASDASNVSARANAARAVGILRGRQAVPDLVQALGSKDSDLIYESLVALEKIRDPSAGPSLAFLLHDLNERVQIAAIEATGLLTNRDALNQLRDVLDRSHKIKVKRAALTAMAQIPDPQLRGIYAVYLDNKDEGLREAAAEGLARLKNSADSEALERAFNNENKTEPRLSVAFALVSLGKLDTAEFDPLRYLVNNLNSTAYRGVARAYLIELARDPPVRQALYPALKDAGATRDEKTGLAEVLAASGGQDSVAPLEALSQDTDSEVSQAGLRAVKNLRARQP